MTKNLFLASCAKAAFALAAVVMMSAAFTACSSSNDDDDGGGGTPPSPEPKAQTVTLDGKEIKIEKANLTKINEDTYWLGLTLEAGKEATDVIIALEPLKHNGKQINLTEQKTEKEGGGWSVAVLKDTKWLCCGEGRKGDIYKFSSGTMTLNVDPTTKKAEVRLTGGKITTTAKYNSGDGKEHTLAINYEGTAIGDDPTPEPLPEPKAQTVTFDGVEKPIVKAEYKDRNDGDYFLFLYLSADGKEKVEFQLNKELHITGSPINLTEKEKNHDGKWYWAVEYDKPDGTKLIDTFGKPGHISPVFTTGTLTMSGSFENINIRLENGRVMGKDGKEHTLTISYSGTMEKVGGETPKPKDNIMTIDGKEKSIVKAEYRYHNNGNYRFHLYLSADGKERVIIDLNKDLHITGNPVDLTKKEKKRDGKFYWEVDYYKPDATSLIHTYARPGFEDPVFTTGTLTMSGSPESTLNIKLENGRVKGEDGKEHTLTINYYGTMTKVE